MFFGDFFNDVSEFLSKAVESVSGVGMVHRRPANFIFRDLAGRETGTPTVTEPRFSKRNESSVPPGVRTRDNSREEFDGNNLPKGHHLRQTPPPVGSVTRTGGIHIKNGEPHIMIDGKLHKISSEMLEEKLKNNE